MKQDVKQKIIDSAITLLMVNPKASMDEIAGAAGVGRATLFRHIRNRKELILELNIQAYHDCNSVLDPVIGSDAPAKEKLVRAITELIPHGADFHFLLKEPPPADDERIQNLGEVYLEKWQVIIRQLKQEHCIAEDIPTVWAARTLDHLIFAAWEAVFYGEIAPRAAPELVIRAFLKGFEK